MHVEDLPPRMRPAGRLGHALVIQACIAGISIRLQDTAEPCEVLPRVLALAVRAVAIQHRRRRLTAEWLIITRVAPQPSRFGLPAAAPHHRPPPATRMHPLL